MFHNESRGHKTTRIHQYFDAALYLNWNNYNLLNGGNTALREYPLIPLQKGMDWILRYRDIEQQRHTN
jgi:hypothetical protein